MKKETIITFVIVILVILVVFLSVKSMKYYQKSQTKQLETKTITVTETLTNVVYDTVFFNHFETVKLQVVDTIVVDSLRIDSVFVEIPISIYKFDTTFCNDTTSLDLFIQNKGYAVTLDSLYYKLEYTPTKTKKTHWFIGPSLGLGYDFTSGKLVPTIGIGIIIKRF